MNGDHGGSLDEFRPLIDRLNAAGAEYALIGGLAVALYGEKYLSPDTKARFQFPIRSKDMDLQGKAALRKQILTEFPALGWRAKVGINRVAKENFPRPALRNIIVETPNGETSIEILDGLPIEEMEFPDEIIGSWIDIDGVVALDPCTLLLTKLAALHDPRRTPVNNDAQHCEILIAVIPEFFKELATLREERGIEYGPTADAWRLWTILDRGRFPLPLDHEKAPAFAQWLYRFTVSSLIRDGKLAPDAEARAAAQHLLTAHGISDTQIAELRVLYTVAGWYQVAVFACQGAPSHVALIDAAGRPLPKPDAERALTYDRLSGGILHTLHYMEPVEPGADPTAVAHARAAYLRWLVEECGSMQLDGLPADSDLSVKRMKLEQLFVPLRLSVTVRDEDRPVADPRTRQEVPGITVGGAHIETESVGAVLSAHSRLSILAAPGGGKSTLLKRLASAYADPERLADVPDNLPRRPWLPLFLRCRELRERAALPILDLLEDLGRHAGAEAAAFEAHLREALQTGEALLLVDGLDEISDDGTRRIFANHLRAFVQAFPRIALVVTSREAGFRIIAGTIAEVCTETHLAPFDENDVQRLCVNWHVEVVGNTDKVRADARELAAAIWANERIRSLVTNPLLLTTLLVVKRWVGQLPQRRVTLYSKAVEVLLMTWNVEGHTPINDEEALPQLSYLACWMMDQGVQRIARSQLIALLKQARQELESELFGTKLTPSEFIERIEHRSSLLIQVGHEIFEEELQPVYEFQHLTFQEYLAARGYVLDHRPGSHDGRKLVDLLEPHFGEAKWREVIALAVALAKREASEIVTRLTATATQAVAKLAYRLMHESASVKILISCLLDEPPISPASAEAAFGLIVGVLPHTYNRKLPMRFAQGRFAPLIAEIAMARFRLLDDTSWYATDYVAACAAVAEGYPWSPDSFSEVLHRLLATAANGAETDQIRACSVIKGIIGQDFFGDLAIQWKRDSPEFLSFIDKAAETLLALLSSNSRPLLLTIGWCLGRIGSREYWRKPVRAEHMELLLSLIERYGESAPRAQMAYAFCGLPLMERDAFQFAQKDSTRSLISTLMKGGNDPHRPGQVLVQVAVILAWYRRGPWSEVELAEQIRDAFLYEMSLNARKMLSTLGEAGRAVLEEWDEKSCPPTPRTVAGDDADNSEV
jgi:hypothetical protein